MPDHDIVLTRAQRDEIMNAVAAIERQLKKGGLAQEMTWMIGMNLMIIRTTVGNVPKTSWN
ncbi:MAG TPA: hypothetical protein VH417_15135 [Vicinamibacterales bacterium]|jgi:hypothetical protein